jgi:hypothetical protein
MNLYVGSDMTAPNVNNPYLAPTIAIPSALEITAISNTNPMVVTVTANTDQMNTYIPGQKVKLTVPVTYGMWQANGLIGTITAVGTNTLTLNIYAAAFDPFVIPASTNMIATLAPIGSSNLQYNNNLTAQVPFQSLNNQGN